MMIPIQRYKVWVFFTIYRPFHGLLGKTIKDTKIMQSVILNFMELTGLVYFTLFSPLLSLSNGYNLMLLHGSLFCLLTPNMGVFTALMELYSTRGMFEVKEVIQEHNTSRMSFEILAIQLLD